MMMMVPPLTPTKVWAGRVIVMIIDCYIRISYAKQNELIVLAVIIKPLNWLKHPRFLLMIGSVTVTAARSSGTNYRSDHIKFSLYLSELGRYFVPHSQRAPHHWPLITLTLHEIAPNCFTWQSVRDELCLLVWYISKPYLSTTKTY